MDERYEFDVILSYAPADRAVVRNIAEGLKAAGLIVWFDQWLADGSDAEKRMTLALSGARTLILFVSTNTLSNRWVAFEEQMYRFRDPGAKGRRFVPVLLDQTALPPSLQEVEHIAWDVAPFEENLNLLVSVSRPPEAHPSARAENAPRIGFHRQYPLASLLAITSLALDLKSNRGAKGDGKGDISIFPLSNPSQTMMTLSGHHGAVSNLHFHPTQDLLLSTSEDRSACLWDLQTGIARSTLSANIRHIDSACFAGDLVAIGLSDGSIALWDPKSNHIPRTLRGHVGGVYCINANDSTIFSGGADRTIRVWSTKTGLCTTILEGHIEAIRSLASDKQGLRLLSGSEDKTVRLWDLATGLCLRTFDAHTHSVKALSWHPAEHTFVSAGGDWFVRLWATDGKLLRVLDGNNSSARMAHFGENVIYSADGKNLVEWRIDSLLTTKQATQDQSSVTQAADQVQYTNAKVLLVGDSSAGKTGLAKRLAAGVWEATPGSTVGAWATQWSLPSAGSEAGEREIWLWDFGGQADQRLIHQLYMDETSLAVLVFDGNRPDAFDGLHQWTRDLTKATTRPVAKLLVAGRRDASPVRFSKHDIETFVETNGFLKYIETSARTNDGCNELRQAIVDGIDWKSIPWRSSPVLFKRLKEEIVRLKDEGRVLMRVNELRDALKLRMAANSVNFSDAELKAVLSLLSGPGVVAELAFGSWVLFRPELINAYGQAVIATMRADPSELGCVSEQRVLSGDLEYGTLQRLPTDEERFVLQAMLHRLLDRGLCAREFTETDAVLVFPNYYKVNRPGLVASPLILVSYQFEGIIEEIYSTLVVRLVHTNYFNPKSLQLWRDAAEIKTSEHQVTVGIRLNKGANASTATLDVYCDVQAALSTKIIFLKYVHEYLLQRGNNVVRRRHYFCKKCSTPVSDLEIAEKRKAAGRFDVACQLCEARIDLNDELEQQYGAPGFQQTVRRLEEHAIKELDNESKERLLVGDVMSTVALSNQISREKSISDHGIDMEIEFKDESGKASGQLLFLQLKSGDSYLRKNINGVEHFSIRDERHAYYWANQIAPVMLVIRTSNGHIRWMEIRNHLKKELAKGKKVSSIQFDGEPLDVASILKWRDILLKEMPQPLKVMTPAGSGRPILRRPKHHSR